MTQAPLFPPDSTWKPTPVSELPSWENAKRIGFDLETKDPDLLELGPGVGRPDCKVVGVSFAIEDGPSYYLPTEHPEGGNLPPEHVWTYLREQARHFKGTVVGANLPYDLAWSDHYGVQFPQVEWFRDIQVADPLIYELHKSYSLENVSRRLGFQGKAMALLNEACKAYGLKNARAELWKLPARFVGEYAEMDAHLPLQVIRKQERLIDKEDLWEVYNLESKVLPVICAMRKRGVAIDWDKVDENELFFLKEIKKCLDFIKLKTNISLSIDDLTLSDPLARVLESIGLEVPKTPKTKKPSISKEFLRDIDHPVAKSLETARKYLKSTRDFVSRLRSFAINGRVHPNFLQLRQEKEDGSLGGAAFGRMSCAKPNLQQIPSRDAIIKKRVRSQYIPDDGCIWAMLDYSQQEPRWTCHWGEEFAIAGARTVCDRYRQDPNLDNHQMMADLTGLPRSLAKDVFLGLCYGMGGAKLSRDLGLPTRWMLTVITQGGTRVTRYKDSQEEAMMLAQEIREANHRVQRINEVAGVEAQEVLNKFHDKIPFVRELARLLQRKAEKNGFIRTHSGRKCHFPMDRNSGTYEWLHKALNRLIQGSSADQTKMAMVRVFEAGLPIQLQVHDELDSSVESESQAHDIAEVMRNCVKLRVPSKVDVELGVSWGEAA